MKFRLILGSVALSLTVLGDETIHPPLTAETLVGTWEALQIQNPATLWHLEINKTGDSHLALVTVGAHCVIWRLISSEVRDGKIRLHFEKGKAKELPDRDFGDLWIIGSGEGIDSEGYFEWTSNGGPSRPEKPWTIFRKGAWTRDVANVSREAEKAIKERGRDEKPDPGK